jgi:hypothetical protein
MATHNGKLNKTATHSAIGFSCYAQVHQWQFRPHNTAFAPGGFWNSMKHSGIFECGFANGNLW